MERNGRFWILSDRERRLLREETDQPIADSNLPRIRVLGQAATSRAREMDSQDLENAILNGAPLEQPSWAQLARNLAEAGLEPAEQ